MEIYFRHGDGKQNVVCAVGASHRRIGIYGGSRRIFGELWNGDGNGDSNTESV
jgi:hypothetical protein